MTRPAILDDRLSHHPDLLAAHADSTPLVKPPNRTPVILHLRRALPGFAAALGLLVLPSAALASKQDRDRDHMPNRWETRHQLNPDNRRDALKDSDRDSLVNRTEYREGCNPQKGDTDADGIPDGYEVRHLLNCHRKRDAAADTDGDGLTNLQE